MFLGLDLAFWYGMILTATVTLIGCLFAWLIPPKKKEE